MPISLLTPVFRKPTALFGWRLITRASGLLLAFLLCSGASAGEAEIGPETNAQAKSKQEILQKKLADERAAQQLAAEVAARIAEEEAKAQQAAMMDLRDRLALTTRERDAILADNQTLRSQLWFMAICAALCAIAAGWLGFRSLKKQSPDDANNDTETMPIPATARATETAVVRKATITIRNSETQREEISEKMETRRIVQKPTSDTLRNTTKTVRKSTSDAESGTLALQPITALQKRAPIAPGTSVFRAQPSENTALQPNMDSAKTENSQPALTTRTQNPKTVRVEQTSERMKAIDVEVKPGTRPHARGGFSLLEVMISIAILATILASVISGMYTLHLTRQMDKENAQAKELIERLRERILIESWSSLFPNNSNSFWAARYAHDRDLSLLSPANKASELTKSINLKSTSPRTFYDLVNQGFMDINYGNALSDLAVYLEKYAPSDITPVISGATTNLYKGALNIPRNIDRDQGSVFFRIVITWTSQSDGQREASSFFARSE
jgi:prepilin-type N-terminal cleavage/methylation domain-containing protein